MDVFTRASPVTPAPPASGGAGEMPRGRGGGGASWRCESRALTESDLPAYVALSRSEYVSGAVCDPVHLRWKLLDNPQGPTWARHLYRCDELVGRLAFQVRELRVGSRALRAGYLVDLLVHPAHRGLRSFLALAGELRDAPGFDLLYVTPNARSAPLYASALRLPETARLSVVGLPLRAGRLLENLVGRSARGLATPADAMLRLATRLVRRPPGGSDLSWTDAPPADDEIDALAEGQFAPDRLIGRRGATFHRWRFGASPVHRYRVHYLRRGGRLVGYVATRMAEYLGYRTLFLIDAIVDATLAPTAFRCIRQRVLEEAVGEGCELMLGIWMREAPGVAELCGLPWIRVPERWLPQAVSLHTLPLTPAAQALPHLDRWALSLADLDVF